MFVSLVAWTRPVGCTDSYLLMCIIYANILVGLVWACILHALHCSLCCKCKIKLTSVCMSEVVTMSLFWDLTSVWLCLWRRLT